MNDEKISVVMNLVRYQLENHAHRVKRLQKSQVTTEPNVSRHDTLISGDVSSGAIYNTDLLM